MNPANVNRRSLFYVRPGFFLALGTFVATLLAVIYLPDFVVGGNLRKIICLSLATLALLAGWLFLLTDHQPNRPWRAGIAMITSVYLTLSVPTFFIEISALHWLVFHPLHREFFMYVYPWVRWGYHGILFIFGGMVGALFGRGRARVAFYIGSVLLLILYFATSPWIL